MQNKISRLVVSSDVLSSIQETVEQTPEGIETGVTLFGVRGDSGFTALSVVGPGPKSIHTPGFHEPDVRHLNDEYERLRQTWPRLEWIGSLHVHPFGMPQLSGHDRNTVDSLFSYPSLRLTEFVAGIIQRRARRLAIYPYVISSDDRSPWLMPLEIVSPESSVWLEAELRAKQWDRYDEIRSSLTAASRPRRIRRLIYRCVQFLALIRRTRDRLCGQTKARKEFHE